MTTDLDVTALFRPLSPYRMGLRTARLIRKGLPQPARIIRRSAAEIAANLTAKGIDPTGLTISPHLWMRVKNPADLAAWAMALDLAVTCDVLDGVGTFLRMHHAHGMYEGWTVDVRVNEIVQPPRLGLHAPRGRQAARFALVGRLV
ncbi:hypothetical protein [Catellatospora sp. NPDC049609]|uniref:hypothetical protein n=1 Tax=Catellatospora sp. NPDC049609 TaxID=3155505 RepID=UPI00343E8E93